MKSRTSLRKILIAVIFSLACKSGFSTWSIIAVDRKTGEIGIAGASCTFDVSGIAYIVPGKGAIVVQAASNYNARMRGVELMYADSAIGRILEAMKDPKFEPEQQQYGVIVLKGGTSPLSYSGSSIQDWNGQMAGEDFLVIGNTLPGEEVISSAFRAFNENRDKPLAERLMLSLKAGEQAGGDKRCGTQYARSAFLMIYKPEHGAILKLAVQGSAKGGKPAVALLEEQFDNWNRKEQE